MLSVFCCIFIRRIATYIGWTSKPTPRSDTTRLRSNVFKVSANDGVFLIACIVMIFNTMVVKDKKVLKTQLTTSVKCKPSALAIFFFFYYITLISVQFLRYASFYVITPLLSRGHPFFNETDFRLPSLNGTLYTVLLKFQQLCRSFEELCKCFLFWTRLTLEKILCETYLIFSCRKFSSSSDGNWFELITVMSSATIEKSP